ncbi:MAG: phosphoglucosamine mutase [Gammaproteobacteria bacterium]|jgi:phosphoglucosamine mutase
MNKQYFGTDGIRGEVGKTPITPDFMLHLGFAAGSVFAQNNTHTVLIGKDTRISGYMFESALEAGLSAAGVNVGLLGVLPTPGIAYLTQQTDAIAGIVISASHNPYQDNGIKFFCRDGQKLSDEVELAIEKKLQESIKTVASNKLGKAHRVTKAVLQYQAFCKNSCENQSLKGLKIVLDCANGATYHVAPELFAQLGADVIATANIPDGFNINVNCGSTSPKNLQARVVQEQADVGIAFDGDGDRVIMVDHEGQLVDGDRILFILAKYKKNIKGVVGTLMSNLGLERSLEKLNIAFARANVGDRYVLELLKQNNWILGGEPSGHMICLDKTSTGDGIIAALQVLQVMMQQKRSLHDLQKDMLFFPQTLINVRVQNKANLLQQPHIQQAIKTAENKLHQNGRVLLRCSGTEPLVRVMVEGVDAHQVQAIAQELATVLEQ